LAGVGTRKEKGGLDALSWSASAPDDCMFNTTDKAVKATDRWFWEAYLICHHPISLLESGRVFGKD
jgi:hypothetical protein